MKISFVPFVSSFVFLVNPLDCAVEGSQRTPREDTRRTRIKIARFIY